MEKTGVKKKKEGEIWAIGGGKGGTGKTFIMSTHKNESGLSTTALRDCFPGTFILDYS